MEVDNLSMEVCNQLMKHLGGFRCHGGIPKMDGLFHGKSHLEMDDDWGCPYFRKPPLPGDFRNMWDSM